MANKALRQRNIISFIHISTALLLVTFVYSKSLSENLIFRQTLQFLIIPLVTLSGIWLWKGHQIKKVFKKK